MISTNFYKVEVDCRLVFIIKLPIAAPKCLISDGDWRGNGLRSEGGSQLYAPVSATTITDSRKGCPYEWSAMDISGNSCRLRSSGASGSPHPTNCAPINHENSRANNIRPHCICFIYCFEQNKTNPSVYASRIRLPYRGAKIDSATNLNLSIRFMYARRYINAFYHDIILRKIFSAVQ